MATCYALICPTAAYFTIASREWKARSTLWGLVGVQPTSFCSLYLCIQPSPRPIVENLAVVVRVMVIFWVKGMWCWLWWQ